MYTVLLSFLLAGHILSGGLEQVHGSWHFLGMEQRRSAPIGPGQAARGRFVSASRDTTGQRDSRTAGLPDGEVFAGFLRADPDMAAEFMRRHKNPLYAFIRRTTAETTDVQALLQETFLRAFRLGSSFSGQGDLKTWLYTVARTICCDHMRAVGPAESSLEEKGIPVLSRLPTPDCAAEQGETGARVQGVLALLPPDQREVVILKYYQDLTFEEIAQVLGCPVATAKSRMRLAVATIKPWLKRLVEANDAPLGERREGVKT